MILTIIDSELLEVLNDENNRWAHFRSTLHVSTEKLGRSTDVEWQLITEHNVDPIGEFIYSFHYTKITILWMSIGCKRNVDFFLPITLFLYHLNVDNLINVTCSSVSFFFKFYVTFHTRYSRYIRFLCNIKMSSFIFPWSIYCFQKYSQFIHYY